tara:strand:+ start:2108 stop:2941 length:834 start_codon:yes stop_codon:yes gene_type:complete
MEPETLFLSGGGMNCLTFLGIFQYLFEKNIIKSKLQGIKNIVCVSGSSILILHLLLGFTLNATMKICLDFKIKELIDYNNFDINQLLETYGLYTNDFIQNLCSTILEKKGLSKGITLQEFYEFTKVNIYFKTSNISKGKIVYISHKNCPNLPLVQVIQMTTCIPLLFQPIKYKGDYYVDGGLCGNFPLEYNRTLKAKNYLGIHIGCKGCKTEIDSVFDYIGSLYKMPWSPFDQMKKNKKIINVIMDSPGLVFSITKEQKKKIIKHGYISALKHFTDS